MQINLKNKLNLKDKIKLKRFALFFLIVSFLVFSFIVSGEKTAIAGTRLNTINSTNTSNNLTKINNSKIRISSYKTMSALDSQSRKYARIKTINPTQEATETNSATNPIVVDDTTSSNNNTNIPENISPETTTTEIITPNTQTNNNMLWGAYVGDGDNDLANFESLVGKEVDLYADFEGWNNSFPSRLLSNVGQKGKTLIIFWEPSFGYDNIINNSQDAYIKKFAEDAKTYKYPVILVPFDEMNLNEEAWGYGINGNTPEKFKTAWKHIHGLFSDAPNVKFGIAFNNVSIPNISGNHFADYYPGDNYVDYVGVDGFNFANPWQTFSQVFDNAIKEVSAFNKPIYIFATASVPGTEKDTWISKGLGEDIKNYPNLAGWVWFNQGGSPNWIINSDDSSLAAFKSIIP